MHLLVHPGNLVVGEVLLGALVHSRFSGGFVSSPSLRSGDASVKPDHKERWLTRIARQCRNESHLLFLRKLGSDDGPDQLALTVNR